MAEKIESQAVRIVDVNMPFASMVGFMIKWAIAAIPAAIILIVIFIAVTAVLTGVFGGFAGLS